jgi:tungstate transport system substrate-binding protein
VRNDKLGSIDSIKGEVLMKARLAILVLTVALLISSISFAQGACEETYGNGGNRFSLATGSLGELGLLKVLADSFTPKTNTTLLLEAIS